MKVLNILLNLIETVTELNSLKYVDGKYDSYFEPCYTAKIDCLHGVQNLTVKIPTFFQALRYNNAEHVSEATFVALTKKYMAAVSDNATGNMIKKDIKKLKDICYSDIRLVLWLDGHLSCNLYNSKWCHGFSNPITREMFTHTGNPFKNEMYYQIIHDAVNYYTNHECLSQALKVYESETVSPQQKRKIEIQRTANGYPSNIAIYLRNHYQKAATATRIYNLRNWEYLKDDSIFCKTLENCEKEEIFKLNYGGTEKFTNYDKLCEETFEDIIGEIISTTCEKKDIVDNFSGMMTNFSDIKKDYVQVECSDKIDGILCATVGSIRVYHQITK